MMTTVTKYNILSHNPQGLKSRNRFAQCVGAAIRETVDILLLQEHNIDEENHARCCAVARRMGYIPCIGVCTDGGRGGSAVLVRRKTFGLLRNAVIPFTTHLSGRLTVAKIPTTEQEGAAPDSPPVEVASLYVPAQPRARKAFLIDLAALSPFTRRMTVL